MDVKLICLASRQSLFNRLEDSRTGQPESRWQLVQDILRRLFLCALIFHVSVLLLEYFLLQLFHFFKIVSIISFMAK